MLIPQITIGCIHLSNKTGPLFPLNRGTLQGNPLSPSLFILAVESLLRNVERKLQGFTIHTKYLCPIQVTNLAFADDITIFADGNQDMESAIQTIQEFCSITRGSLNYDKSKVVISPYATDIAKTEMQLFDNLIEHVKKEYELTYLGIKIPNQG